MLSWISGLVGHAADTLKPYTDPYTIWSIIDGKKRDDRNAGMTQQSLDLSREALNAQKQQQQWLNEQYLENRDYERALQERIFEREDTAMTRSVEDHVNAGFSPLAALGTTFNAGQVVSSSQAPSNQVQNNQFQNFDSGALSRALEVATQRSDTALGRSLQKFIEVSKIKSNESEGEKNRQNAKAIAELQGKFAKELQDDEQESRAQELVDTHFNSKEIQRMINEASLEQISAQGQNAQSLQDDAQSWQDNRPQDLSPWQIAEKTINAMIDEYPDIKEFVGEKRGYDALVTALIRLMNMAKDSMPFSDKKIQNALNELES